MLSSKILKCWDGEWGDHSYKFLTGAQEENYECSLKTGILVFLMDKKKKGQKLKMLAVCCMNHSPNAQELRSLELLKVPETPPRVSSELVRENIWELPPGVVAPPQHLHIDKWLSHWWSHLSARPSGSIYWDLTTWLWRCLRGNREKTDIIIPVSITHLTIVWKTFYFKQNSGSKYRKNNTIPKCYITLF